MRFTVLILAAAALLAGSFPARADTYKIIRTEAHDEGKTYTIKCGRGSEHRILHYALLGQNVSRYYYGARGRGGWDSMEEAAKEVCDMS